MRVCKHVCDITLSVFPEKYFIKAIEDFFRVYIAASKHSGVGRILKSYANPRRSRGFA